jgi:outer membrane lipoprotein-sorting protein
MSLFRQAMPGRSDNRFRFTTCVFLFFFLLLLFGCSHTLRRPAIPSDETRWRLIPQLLQNNYNRLKTFKASGRMIVESPEQSFSTSSRVVISRPDSLYLKLEATFGIDVGWLFSDRKTFRFYSPQRNMCYYGSFDSLRVGDFFSFDLSYDKFLQALAGIELVDGLDSGQLEKDGKSLLLTGETGQKKVSYWIDPSKGVVTRSEVRDSRGQVILQSEYQRFAYVDHVYVPRTIRIKRPLERERLTLYYTRLEINKKINDNDIRTKIPDSALTVEM